MLHLLTYVSLSLWSSSELCSCLPVVASTMFVDLVSTWMFTVTYMANKATNLCIAVSCSALPFRRNYGIFVHGIGSRVPKCSCMGKG
uniref:Secreted protein n=1 Tax=Rhipicephalus appendiculatus TaxID=34631 RepID=A0A131YZH2_RHIAP